MKHTYTYIPPVKDGIKEQQPVAMLPLIQSPELIKVKTISPKIVKQLPFVAVDADVRNHEIIGRAMFDGGHIGDGVVLLRHKETGQLSRMADGVYMEIRGKEGMKADVTWDEVRQLVARELAALPQIFEV